MKKLILLIILIAVAVMVFGQGVGSTEYDSYEQSLRTKGASALNNALKWEHNGYSFFLDYDNIDKADRTGENKDNGATLRMIYVKKRTRYVERGCMWSIASGLLGRIKVNYCLIGIKTGGTADVFIMNDTWIAITIRRTTRHDGSASDVKDAVVIFLRFDHTKGYYTHAVDLFTLDSPITKMVKVDSEHFKFYDHTGLIINMGINNNPSGKYGVYSYKHVNGAYSISSSYKK